MALLWHDGLSYFTGSSFLTSRYAGNIFGVTAGLSHPLQGRLSIGGTLGFLRIPHPAPSGNVCTIGFLFRVDSFSLPIPDNSIFLAFRDSTTASKIRVHARTSSTGIYFEFVQAVSGVVVLRTTLLPFNQWFFLEFQVKFSTSQGECVFRINGNELARRQNLNTDPNPALAWNHPYITFGASPALWRVADLYVLDGSGSDKTFKSFLGPIVSNKVFPGVIDYSLSENTWKPEPTNGGKYKIIVIAGQSNADGLGQPPYTTDWRSPNPSLLTWNTGTNAWEPLNVATNAWGQLYVPPNPLPWHGPNMRLGERIALLYGGGPSPVRLFQLAFGGSAVAPGGVTSWHPSSPGGLFSQSLAHINNGIAALGGVSAIERIDLFWYQGETETLLESSAATFPGLFVQWTLDTLFGIVGALLPIPTYVYSVKIHKDMTVVFPGMVEKIRGRQEYMRKLLNADGIQISVDDYRLRDGVHLDDRGLNDLGNRIFDIWARYQDFAGYIRDESSLLSPDSKDLRGSAGDKMRAQQLFVSQYGMVNNPTVAEAVLGAVESASGETLHTSLGADIALPTVSAWGSVRGTKQKIRTPEQATSDINLSL